MVLNELSKEEIEPKIFDQLARVDTRSIKRTLDQLDWILNSEVSRNWLRKEISILVEERVAIAKLVNTPNVLINFDSDGSTFVPTSPAQLEKQMELPLVLIQEGSEQDLLSVANLLKNFPEDLRYLLEELGSISVSKSGQIFMDTRFKQSALRINWGESSEIAQKSKVLSALLLLPEKKAFKQIDLSQPDSPIVS